VVIEKRFKEKDETLWQHLTLPVEECLRYGIAKPAGTYRWFKSPNVVALEHFRRAGGTKPEPPKAA
jgi:hypothetical protein